MIGRLLLLPSASMRPLQLPRPSSKPSPHSQRFLEFDIFDHDRSHLISQVAAVNQMSIRPSCLAVALNELRGERAASALISSLAALQGHTSGEVRRLKTEAPERPHSLYPGAPPVLRTMGPAHRIEVLIFRTKINFNHSFV